MVAINFKAQFADAVASGKKRQTIRKRSKKTPSPGQTLQLYTGQRTKSSRLLKEMTCLTVQDVVITDDSLIDELVLTLDGKRSLFTEARAIALADGFDSLASMRDFFKDLYGLPFEGVLIRW
ncbi:MAG: hypothetical protein DCF22_00690 [Leptolyngbya sp.]|nr:MAG: hypothetical protein DCF22_00690 [Leptolyngbya sp.]